jgi:hypothetical protein
LKGGVTLIEIGLFLFEFIFYYHFSNVSKNMTRWTF